MESNRDECQAAVRANRSISQFQPPQPYQPRTPHLTLSQYQPFVTTKSAPPRQYTTVGSLYNPQSQPLQPPVRRGRAVKTLFPYKTDSSAGPSQLQYIPLQQNSDRALSPPPLDLEHTVSALSFPRQEENVFSRHSPTVPYIHRMSSSTTPYSYPYISELAKMTQMTQEMLHEGDCGHDDSTDVDLVRSNMPSWRLAVDADDHTVLVNDAESDTGSDESDETDTKPVQTMNFNSLTNLASYPNPMQRAAQKVLASHRPQPSLAINPHDPDGQSKHYHTDSDSLGYGAPAPLTAGPPGVRQHRPPIYERETLLQRARDFDDETPVLNPYNAHPLPDLYLTDPPSDGDIYSSALFENSNHRVTSIIDTLSTSEARNFFPNRLPADFNPLNPRERAIFSDWEQRRLAKCQARTDTYLAQDENFWAARKKKIDNQFYSGANMFKKPFKVVVSDQKNRNLIQFYGPPYQQSQKHQKKIMNHRIQVREISSSPTSEYALPLLSMAYQALANRPEISQHINLPGFKHSLFPDYLRD